MRQVTISDHISHTQRLAMDEASVDISNWMQFVAKSGHIYSHFPKLLVLT